MFFFILLNFKLVTSEDVDRLDGLFFLRLLVLNFLFLGCDDDGLPQLIQRIFNALDQALLLDFLLDLVQLHVNACLEIFVLEPSGLNGLSVCLDRLLELAYFILTFPVV